MKPFRKYQNLSFIVRFVFLKDMEKIIGIVYSVPIIWYCIMSKSKSSSAETDCIQDWDKEGKPCKYYFNQGLEMAIPWTRKMDMLGESS